MEFKGLRAQYLIYFIVGVVSLFMLFIILRMLDVNVMVSLAILVGLAIVLLRIIFYLNKQYGPYGLAKMHAFMRCPHFLISRKSFKTILVDAKHKTN